MRMFWFITMAALCGIGGSRNSCPASTVLFVLMSFRHGMFLYDVICVHHCGQIPILEGAMEPLCLWKIQRLRLMPLLYLGAKESWSYLVDISSEVSSNLARFYFWHAWLVREGELGLGLSGLAQVRGRSRYYYILFMLCSLRTYVQAKHGLTRNLLTFRAPDHTN